MPEQANAQGFEAARLAALKRYAILDTPPEPAFDRIVRMAAHSFGVPIAIISLVDAERVWFKAALGFGATEIPRAATPSSIAIESFDDLTVVLDTALDPRFRNNPLLSQEPPIRFYAGAPLVTADGYPLGTLCVVDTVPRADFSAAQRLAMRDFAAMVMDQLELRHETAQREIATRTAHLRERLLASNAEAPTPRQAIEAAMGVVREATGSLLCLFFRTAPDGLRLQLLGGEGDGPHFDDAYLDAIREARMTLGNSLSGAAIRSGNQVYVERFTPEFLARYPGVKASADRGMRSQLVTPVSLGSDRYTIALGFAEDPSDLEETKALMQEVTSTLRPLLRRLREAEVAQLFQRAVDATGDAVIISDAEPVTGAGPIIRYVNNAFLEQTGYLAEEVIGQTPRILDGPDTSDAARHNIRAALAKQMSVRQEIVTYRRDASTFWADLHIAPVADATGWFTHWVAIQRDVTAQKTEALTLAEREAFFRYFFEQHPAPMWVYDRETFYFQEVNEAAIRAYGWSREEFRQRTILEIRPPEDREAARAMVERLSPEYSDSGPWRHITASGETRLVQTRGQVIQLRGRTAHLVVIWDVTERIIAENEARDLAQQLNTTLESISDGFFTLNAHWQFNYVNAQAEIMLGQPAGSLLGRAMEEVLPEAAGAALAERLRGILREGKTERFLHHDPAAERWFDVTGYPAQGGLTVYLRDVTARRISEERLRLLETAVNKLNDVILITEAEPIDAPGPRIVFVNAAFERLTGFSPGEVFGRSPRFLQGEGTSRRELDRIRTALENWQPVRAELLNYTKDGTEFWVELDIVPVSDGSGWFTHWVAVERDVTERKRAQIKLEEQAALLDQSRDAIMVQDMDHRITYWNRSAERLYGWTAQEAQGRSAVELLYADPAPFLTAQQALLADGHWTGTMRHRRKDGETVIIEAYKTLLRDASGNPRAILAVESDVTDQLALEAQLRQAQRMEAVGQLTGGIAHDFNNLLTVVLGNAEMLVERLRDEPELRSIAAVTLAAAERGAALTSRLLAFSRRQTLDPKVVDVSELLIGLKELIRRAIGERVDVELISQPGLWPALIDPPQLETAVLNLCINARDAMPLGGRIVIEMANIVLQDKDAGTDATPGDYVVLAVSDSGTGMPPDVLARAFEPFFTTKEVGKGNGLGLSMVYGFVKQSGGHVKIDSEVGRGTTIRIYIPRAEGVAAAPAAAPRQAENLRGRERVLLVEDDPLVRDHSARQLRSLGYEVEVAQDARAALRALRGGTDCDLLFTDIVMPGGMTGHELAVEAQLLRPGLPILFTSGYTEQSGAHQGWLKPGLLLLTKPYRLRELAEKIRQALDRVD